MRQYRQHHTREEVRAMSEAEQLKLMKSLLRTYEEHSAAEGYLVAFCVYQFGTLLTAGTLGTAFVPGLVIVAAFVGVLAYLIMKANKDVAAEYALKSKPAQV